MSYQICLTFLFSIQEDRKNTKEDILMNVEEIHKSIFIPFECKKQQHQDQHCCVAFFVLRRWISHPFRLTPNDEDEVYIYIRI